MNNDFRKGLSSEEVQILRKEGKVNKSKKVKGKSHFKIIFESFFTSFNIVLYLLAFTFLMFQIFYPDGIRSIPITKYGFLTTILFNALTSIISQEMSKHTLEKMKLISDPRILVIRDGKEVEINTNEIVLHDSIILKTGKDVPCDAIIEEGELYVNESNLTGESDALIKKKGDIVLSGSFVVGGFAILKAEKVGNDTYISSIERKISSIRKKKSELLLNIHKIINILLIFIIPVVLSVGLKMFYVGTYPSGGKHWVFTLNIVTKCGASLVGMIPIGMILLSSITLSESIIKLSKKKTMVQELYAIENLSRVDTLCLDKTGTLTTQKFKLVKTITLQDLDINSIMSSYLSAFKETNPTSEALICAFGNDPCLKINTFLPFNSKNKYSAVQFENGETYRLGASEFLTKDQGTLELVKRYSLDGFRVLCLTKNSIPAALFLLKDELRVGIKDTLKYFKDLKIDIKIISGDNPITVKEVAKDAGVLNYEAFISMENVKIEEIKDIVSQYTIFGRTSPDQKQEIIKQLQLQGKKVGYVGDGVNDVTPLRQADCSIALQNGADSTKAVSDVVLLDNDFSHLPDVFLEGRRVVTNIQRSIYLFLTKSFFVAIFSFSSVFMPIGMPLEIESIYIYEFISIALCGFLLSIENNKPEPIKGRFVNNVLLKSLYFGSFMTISALLPVILNPFVNYKYSSSLIVIFITLAGLIILSKVCKPYRKYTIFVLLTGIISSITLALAFPDIFFNPRYLKQAQNLGEQFKLIFDDFYNLNLFKSFTNKEWITILVYLILGPIVFYLIDFITKIVLKNKAKDLKKDI